MRCTESSGWKKVLLGTVLVVAFGSRPAAASGGGVHDPGFAYVDVDNDGLFGPGDYRDILPFIRFDGVFDAALPQDGPGGTRYPGYPGAGIVIPPSVGLVSPALDKRYTNFAVSADGNVLVEAPFEAKRPNRSAGTLSFTARGGDLVLGTGPYGGVEFDARFFVLRAGGALDVSGSTLAGRGGCAIRTRSGGETSLANAHLHIRRLEVASGGSIDARSVYTHFTASSSVTVILDAVGTVDLSPLPGGDYAYIRSRFLTVLAKGGDVLAPGAHLVNSPSSGSWILLEARSGYGGAGGNVDVTAAFLKTGRTITLHGGSPSGGDEVIVSGAVLDDQDDTAAVCPRGIAIVGTPLYPYKAAYGGECP